MIQSKIYQLDFIDFQHERGNHKNYHNRSYEAPNAPGWRLIHHQTVKIIKLFRYLRHRAFLQIRYTS